MRRKTKIKLDGANGKIHLIDLAHVEEIVIYPVEDKEISERDHCPHCSQYIHINIVPDRGECKKCGHVDMFYHHRHPYTMIEGKIDTTHKVEIFSHISAGSDRRKCYNVTKESAELLEKAFLEMEK